MFQGFKKFQMLQNLIHYEPLNLLNVFELYYKFQKFKKFKKFQSIVHCESSNLLNLKPVERYQ